MCTLKILDYKHFIGPLTSLAGWGAFDTKTNTMKQYSIEINGSGTIKEIIIALKDNIALLKSNPESGIYEDDILITEINEIEED